MTLACLLPMLLLRDAPATTTFVLDAAAALHFDSKRVVGVVRVRSLVHYLV